MMSPKEDTAVNQIRVKHGVDHSRPSFLQNCWYAVAWSEEIGERPFGLTICGHAIVFLRCSDGNLSALDGLCPHRFASLSSGTRLPNDTLQCPYHGLVFDVSGRCVGNPHGAVPRVARLRRHPTVERHSIVWLWYGEEEQADETLIPDFSAFENIRYRTVRARLKTGANYELITDNLLDLSHVAYVHAGGIGSDAIASGRHEVVQSGTTLFSNRWCPDAPAAPVWAALFGGYEANVDHWLNMRWDAPSTMLLDVGVAPVGQSRSEGITVFGAHMLTPETESSTHYLFAGARDFAQQSKEVDLELKAYLEKAFVSEDRPILEQIQFNMQGRPLDTMSPLMLASDEAAVRARRLLNEIRSRRQAQLPSVREWRGNLLPQ